MRWSTTRWVMLQGARVCYDDVGIGPGGTAASAWLAHMIYQDWYGTRRSHSQLRWSTKRLGAPQGRGWPARGGCWCLHKQYKLIKWLLLADMLGGPS